MEMWQEKALSLGTKEPACQHLHTVCLYKHARMFKVMNVLPVNILR